MKRFLIHVSTSWCGMDDTFRAMAENDYELDEIADQLAYENFQFYDCENDIAKEFGYDPDDMEDEPELFRGGDIAFSTARRVMEMLGWKCSYAGKATLGQDAYYCIICTKPDKDFKYKIFGNAYEGSISKENYER